MKMPEIHKTNRRTLWFLAAVVPFCLFLSGCLGLGYQAGTKSLFGQDVETVYVPIFESDDSKRDLAERLTEAVCKRIEARTPYKVVGRPTADSVLEGRILSRKQVNSITDRWSNARQKTSNMSVSITWRDRRNRDLTHSDTIPWADGSGRITTSSLMHPEIGQSELTMEQDNIDKIAEQIVGMMELPW